MSPRDVVAAVLPDPAALGKDMRGRTCAGSWVRGAGPDGEDRSIYLYHVVDNAWSMREFGHQAVVWQTAVMPAVAIEMLATGAWSGAGVLGPEALQRRPVPRTARRAGHRVGVGRLAAPMPIGVPSPGGYDRRAPSHRITATGVARRRPITGWAKRRRWSKPGLVGQEAVAVGVDELDDLEVVAAVPRLRGGEQRRPLGEVDGGEAAAQLVVEQADELDADRDLGPRGERVAHETEQPAGGDRRQPEHDDVGEADVVGKVDVYEYPACGGSLSGSGATTSRA